LSQIQGQTLDILWVFFILSRIFPTATSPNHTMAGLQIHPHDGSITQWVFLFFYHYTFQGVCLRTLIPPLEKTTGLLNSWVFPFLPRTSPTSTDRQGGVSFQSTPMGKITHTHTPRTPGEYSTTYLRVRICAYSPRTGIRSKCLQLSP